MSDNRSAAYWEGSTLILRASGFGGCIGALVRSAQGFTASPPPKHMQDRYDQGNKAEPIIVAELKRRGHLVQHTHKDDGGQLELEIDVAGKVIIRVHPDGLINRSVDGEWPLATETLEIKALRPSFDRTFRPYEWQNSIEDAASGLRVLKVYGTKDESGELVRDKDGNVELEIVEQGPPVYSLVDIKRRALEIYRAALNNDTLECDFKQYPCGFYREEGTACHWSPEKKDETPVEILPIPGDKVRMFREAKAMKSMAEEDIKELDNHFKSMLKDRPGDKYRTEDGSITFTKNPGQKKLDKAKLARDHPEIDLSKYETIGKPYWRTDISKD